MILRPRTLQKQPVEYLSPGIRPEEFSIWLPEFLAEHHVSASAASKVLADENMSAVFVRWIDDNGIVDRWLGEKQEIVKLMPPRLIFRDPQPMAAGSWLLHHTPSTKRFFSFRYGCPGSKLAYAWNADRVVVLKNNLSSRHHAADRVWIFGFTPDEDICVGVSGEFQCTSEKGWVAQYGTSAVLFRTDAGVSAFHEGDQERQAMAPGGTEYDTAWLEGKENGAWEVWVPHRRKMLGAFETFGEVTEAVGDAYESARA